MTSCQTCFRWRFDVDRDDVCFNCTYDVKPLKDWQGWLILLVLFLLAVACGLGLASIKAAWDGAP